MRPDEESSYKRPGIRRRSLLIAMASATVVGGVGGAHLFLRDVLKPELKPSGSSRSLTEPQVDTLWALVEVLVPSRYRVEPPIGRSIILTAAKSVEGLAAQYADGARLLDRNAREPRGRPFAALTLEAREGIVDGLLWQYPAPSAVAGFAHHLPKFALRLERMFQTGAVRRFRELVVRDLLVRFYLAVPSRVIGYENLPGVPGNPRDYVSAPQSRPKEV